MTKIRYISYDSFNKARKALGFQMTELSSTPFDKGAGGFFRTLSKKLSGEETPWHDQYKRVELESHDGQRLWLLFEFTPASADSCYVYMGLPGEASMFQALTKAIDVL